jgi:hypothetical protein
MYRYTPARACRAKFSWIDAAIMMAVVAYGALSYAETHVDLSRAGSDVRLMMSQSEFDARSGYAAGHETKQNPTH